MPRKRAIALLAATGLLASISASPAAHAAEQKVVKPIVFSGLVEAWAGFAFIAGERGGADPDNEGIGDFGGNARFSFPVVDGFSIQADVVGEITTNGEDDNNFDSSVIGAAHLSWRDPTSGLFGIFGGGGTKESEGETADLWFVGVEGQKYWDSITLYGQAGYLDSCCDAGGASDGDAFHDAFFLRGVVRYFLSNTSSLQGEVSYANGEQDTDDISMDIVSWGARYDFMPPGFPASLFLAYRGGFFDNAPNGFDDGIFHDHTFMVGFRVAFGSGKDLRSNDRTGATLDLPDIGRWVGSGNIVD